jgi:hypothetical protein
VERGHRFHRRNSSGPLAGRLSIGVVPSALPMVALMTKAIQLRYPGSS